MEMGGAEGHLQGGHAGPPLRNREGVSPYAPTSDEEPLTFPSARGEGLFAEGGVLIGPAFGRVARPYREGCWG
jgi:hypothetical protein